MKFTAAQIAGILNGDIEGNPDVEVFKLSKLKKELEGALTFLANSKIQAIYIYYNGVSNYCQ